MYRFRSMVLHCNYVLCFDCITNFMFFSHLDLNGKDSINILNKVGIDLYPLLNNALAKTRGQQPHN